MHKVDNRRSTLLPVFDPCYKPHDRPRRHRHPLIQQPQQQQPHHHPSSQGCDGGTERSQRADRISRGAAKTSDATGKRLQETSEKRLKTSEKRLRREKVVRWKALDGGGDTKERHPGKDETVSEGRSQFISTNT